MLSFYHTFIYAMIFFVSFSVEAQKRLLPLTEINTTNSAEKRLIENAAKENSTIKKANADFLTQHWQQPIQTRSLALSSESKQKSQQTISPQACAACHPKKFIDWQGSLHAGAMSIGVLVQLKMLTPHALNKHYLNKKGCMHCHAPTKIQQDSLIKVINNSSNSTITNQTSGDLHQQGVMCAACHIRNDHWFGPGSVNKTIKSTNKAEVGHPKSQSSDAFGSSQFCSNCHQFNESDPSLAGKPIQNTFNEWQDSHFAQEGVSCQQCHMPDKRHLFKGIHDKNMVLSGVTIQSEFSKKRKFTKNGSQIIEAYLMIKNTGVGHHFPTYVTPRVVLRGYQIDQKGNMLVQTLLEYEIMRAVSLDLQDEYFDSRLAVGQSYRFEYQQALLLNAEQFVFTITVEPDYFYQQFFTELLDQHSENNNKNMLLKEPSTEQIFDLLKESKQKTNNSSYILFSKNYKLH